LISHLGWIEIVERLSGPLALMMELRIDLRIYGGVREVSDLAVNFSGFGAVR